MTTERAEVRTSEAARILGVSDSTVVRYAVIGVLRCRLLPSGHRRFLRADVEGLRENPPPAKWSRSIAQNAEGSA